VREEAADLIPALLRRWRDPLWTPSAPEAGVEPEGLETRPWAPVDGDPSDPEMVAGALVVDKLRVRGDRAGALVLLENGRLAVTGPSVAVGNAGLIRRYAGGRLAVALSLAEQGWWREVMASLSR
jgi:cell volume regulation protein A